MKPVYRLLVLLSTIGLVTVSAVAPAGATTETLVDPHGDAPASADVYSYTLSNGERAVHTAVLVKNLAKRSDITLFVDQTGPGRYVIRTSPAGKGTFTFERRTSSRPVDCDWTLKRLTGSRSTMKIGIPQTCFGSRAGDAAIDLIMWQAGGQGSDNVAQTFVPRG
jgi:hypothetical protein